MLHTSPESLRFTCRRIFIRGLKLSCRIGAYDNERTKPQTVLVDCDLWVRLSQSTSARDNLADVLNYDLAVDAIRKTASGEHIDLQETLVDRMTKTLAELPDVELVRVATAKPEAYADADAVGVESWRVPANRS